MLEMFVFKKAAEIIPNLYGVAITTVSPLNKQHPALISFFQLRGTTKNRTLPLNCSQGGNRHRVMI